MHLKRSPRGGTWTVLTALLACLTLLTNILLDNVGDVLLSGGKLLKRIYLGNFAQMKSEDS